MACLAWSSRHRSRRLAAPAPVLRGDRRKQAASRGRGTPEAWSELQKFQTREHLASFAANQARHATGEVLVRLQVGENQFLGTNDTGGNWNQSAAGAYVDGFGVFGKRLTVELAVHLHRQEYRQTLGPALIVQGTDHFLARLLLVPAAAPPSNPGEKPRPAHTHPREDMRPSELARKDFRRWEVTRRSHPKTKKFRHGCQNICAV